MKFFVTFLSAMFLLVGAVPEADAKRFGSGGFGKSYSSPFKSSPAKQPAKATPEQGKAAPGRGGMMGGMMGGLLAGGLFAYLLGSGAFEGLQIMDMLLIGLAVFVIFRLLKGMGANQARRPQAANAMGGHQGAPHAQHFQAEQAFNSGSAVDAQEHPLNLPDNVDADAFIGGALDHYRLVQQAWNDGNLDLIREYVSQDLFDALAAQRNRLMVPPKTDIVDLNAEIVRADETTQKREISILFRGLCKDELEKSEDGIFDVWHLERDLNNDDAPWIVVGIEAE
jgi:predicted lipid-binding transport protein (Tim44 family)